MTYDRRDPVKAYQQALVRAKKLLVDIDVELDKLTKDQARKPTDWGYFGTCAEVASQLDNIEKFLSGKN